MNFLKSFLKPLFDSDPGIGIRNLVGFRVVGINLPMKVSNFSSSDLFLWRTDSEFRTVFRVSDIPKAYFGISNTRLLMVFYDRAGVEIKREEADVDSNVLEVVIDSARLGGVEDYGAFSAFHLFDGSGFSDVKITNRCYVGYQLPGSIPSYVHGNLHAQYVDLDDAKPEVRGDVMKVLGAPTRYKIQKDFSNFDRSEIVFSNPAKVRAWFRVNDAEISLDPLNSLVLDVGTCRTVDITSNLFLPRPLVFSYRGKFYDCHHA